MEGRAEQPSTVERNAKSKNKFDGTPKSSPDPWTGPLEFSTKGRRIFLHNRLARSDGFVPYCGRWTASTHVPAFDCRRGVCVSTRYNPAVLEAQCRKSQSQKCSKRCGSSRSSSRREGKGEDVHRVHHGSGSLALQTLPNGRRSTREGRETSLTSPGGETGFLFQSYFMRHAMDTKTIDRLTTSPTAARKQTVPP